jgi:hypothetical protein
MMYCFSIPRPTGHYCSNSTASNRLLDTFNKQEHTLLICLQDITAGTETTGRVCFVYVLCTAGLVSQTKHVKISKDLHMAWSRIEPMCAPPGDIAAQWPGFRVQLPGRRYGSRSLAIVGFCKEPYAPTVPAHTYLARIHFTLGHAHL